MIVEIKLIHSVGSVWQVRSQKMHILQGFAIYLKETAILPAKSALVLILINAISVRKAITKQAHSLLHVWKTAPLFIASLSL